MAVATVDTDVTAEMAEIGSADGASGASVELVDLRREFSSIAFRRGKGRLAFIHRFVRQKLAAVKGVSLSFRSGNVFALLGHNGAGKTTTFSMIAAQLEPSHGDVSVHGMSCVCDAPTVRRLLGICPQHDILYPDLTAEEHLELYGRLTGMSVDECVRCVPGLLQQVRLHTPELARRSAGRFSGGMQRRLSVACAFIGNPVGCRAATGRWSSSTSRRRGWTR